MLAFDEAQEQNHTAVTGVCFEQEMTLINRIIGNSPSAIVKIEGRVTVSF